MPISDWKTENQISFNLAFFASSREMFSHAKPAKNAKKNLLSVIYFNS